MTLTILFFILLGLVALLYASVGHGGATGYIAVMSIFNYAPEEIKHTALLLNLVVAGTAFIFNITKTKLNWHILIPLLVCSIPASYWGSSIVLSNHTFHYLLAVVLFFPVYYMLFPPSSIDESTQKAPLPYLLLCGLIIGFLSGLLGIGGGIFLSPILILNRWCTTKETSVNSALFIVLNSLSGLSAIYQDLKITSTFIPIILVVSVGGILGGYYGSRFIQPSYLRKMIALVLLIAIVKLLIVS